MAKQIEQCKGAREKPATLERVREFCGIEEEMGFEAPFLTFSWEHWQAWQARVLQCFTSFQRAVQNQQPHQATLISLEMQELALELQKEACAWLWPDASQKASLLASGYAKELHPAQAEEEKVPD